MTVNYFRRGYCGGFATDLFKRGVTKKRTGTKKIVVSLFLLGILGVSMIDLNSYNMKNIKSFLADQVSNHQTPSIQYYFFDTDSIIFGLSEGFKNIKSKEPVDSSTTYHLYSITKTFTALAVLQLAEAGKVELTKSVHDYLDDFPYTEKITIEQLLSHTAGIPNPLPLKWIHLATEHSRFERNQFFEEVFKDNPKLEFEPGTKFKYSNLGYVILGQLVERVSGQSLEDYIGENIIQRSNIAPSDLSFAIDPSTHATGYHKWWSFGNAFFGLLIDKAKFMGKREGRWKPFNFFYNNGTAYGGMFGSPNGLIGYAQALLRNNSVLLGNKYKQKLFAETSAGNRSTGMALSWFTGMLKGNKYLAHAGGGGGYYVEIRIYPQLGVGSVIMYNRSGMTDERILDKADGFFIAESSTLSR